MESWKIPNILYWNIGILEIGILENSNIQIFLKEIMKNLNIGILENSDISRGNIGNLVY